MANEEIIGSSSIGATERPFKFEGNHFKRWQQKMFFFLTLKKCAYVLKDLIPVVPDVPTDASASGTKEQPVNTNGQTVSAAEPDKGKATAEQLKEKALQIEKERQLWIDNDYVCKNYIINGLEDDLYDYYRTYETASDVWEALSKKYDTEEAGAKKYVVSRYLKYQMVDKRSVEVQSHELQKIAHEIITEGMPLHEQFQISVIIDKLPPSWKAFKNQLRHKTKEFSIEGLITRLRIEEESRKQDMKEEEKILVVSNNNKKKFGAALKPTGKPLKIQNQSRNQNRVKNALVMRYLKRTMNLGLHYQRFLAVLEGYSDADWNTLSDDSKATSGFIFSIAGGAVSWKSKKQTILAQSTMESEMIALATASEEASWLRCLLSEIPLWEKPMSAVLIHCDSTAAIAKIENSFYNGRRRQIRRKHSTVRATE
ncbi:hypothetical protein TSUD_238340 [Trifolium subterraneum]|uniref:Reverse transcriptase Ty1/copia-type domain-containing protein n=1 Tax=Trifolium subterraneum TaxID=3900 RepID=A0A2Z6PEW0_TRISU|nr:hypothetical protein TSUD_238340 [Trifolium subterraneum]